MEQKIREEKISFYYKNRNMYGKSDYSKQKDLKNFNKHTYTV